jgi:hypothetical protein
MLHFFYFSSFTISNTVRLCVPCTHSYRYSSLCIAIRRPMSYCQKYSASSGTDATSASSPSRKYFYIMDSKGQLFLSDCKHKNFISSLKDKVFLNMFFRLLRENHFQESEIERKEGYHYLSPCGNELNYLKIDDPIACCVFGSFRSSSSSLSSALGVSRPSFSSVDRTKPIPAADLHGDYDLFIGGSDIKESFSPNSLYVDIRNGRFYHEINSHRHLKGKLGLMQGLISQLLSQVIIPMTDNSHKDRKEEQDETNDSKDGYFIIKWDNKEYRIEEIHKWKEKYHKKVQ